MLWGGIRSSQCGARRSTSEPAHQAHCVDTSLAVPTVPSLAHALKRKRLICDMRRVGIEKMALTASIMFIGCCAEIYMDLAS